MALDYKIRLGDEVTTSWTEINNTYVKVKVIKSRDNQLHFDIGEIIGEKEYFKRKLAGTL